MASYSLDLAPLPDEATGRYVPSHDFPNEMRRGDRFTYNGFTWQVIEVTMKQFDAAGEPAETLYCVQV